MGAINCPETPRQKMINMMYLVLTAMLALNVAAETLDAFKIVDSSLIKTYLSFTDKNEALMVDFGNAYEINQDKAGKWLEMAKRVHLKSNSVENYIVDTKVLLVEGAGGYIKIASEPLSEQYPYVISNSGDTLMLEHQDDLNISPLIMLTRKRGKELQDLIIGYKEELIQIVADYPLIIENLESSLDVNDPVRDKKMIDKDQMLNFKTWAQQQFEATPVIASITLLSKLQIDVRNAESAVLRHLYNQIDASSFKFTGLKATVIPDASYIFQGQDYRARIFLSAEDSTQDLEVYMNGSENPLPVEGNEAIFSIKPNDIGTFTQSGEIKYRNPDGDGYGMKSFNLEYSVTKPAVTISPIKMNVLYKDLQNPISVSATGVLAENIEAECTNGKMYKDGENWIIEPLELDYAGENTKVIVYADFNGIKRRMGEMVYRVKKVPDPKATVAQMTSGIIPRERLRLQSLVSATLDDFDFDLAFEVTSFDMSVPSSGGLTTTIHSNSLYINKEQKELLSGLGAGDRVSFENIKAKISGDDKDVERQLSPIILTVQ
jgi:gliding motility-associated protein GldM